MCILCSLGNLDTFEQNTSGKSIQELRRQEVLNAVRTIFKCMIKYNIDMKEVLGYDSKSIRSFDESYDTVMEIKDARKTFAKYLNLPYDNSNDTQQQQSDEIQDIVNDAVKSALSQDIQAIVDSAVKSALSGEIQETRNTIKRC